ncbi:MAG: helix-turn-helix domain-containing protein [Thermomicrobiaceae bacterium]|nr:helix-turn-helix domain-containing protein [Thermomicrobiaceae bacterium]
MAMVTGQFERVAEAVTERAAELLSATVSVLDERGVVVASSNDDLVGLPFDLAGRGDEASFLRVPIHLDSQRGEVVVAQPETGEVISPRLGQVLVDLVISQAAVVDRLPNQHELKNKFIHDLLRGPIGDEADILREAQILGMDFRPPRAVILIDAASYILAPDRPGREVTESSIRRRSQLVIASVVGFFALPNDTICAYIGDGEVAVLKASSTQDLVAWTEQEDAANQASPSWANLTALKRASTALLARLRRDTGAPISIGIGRYHPGVRGLASSYQDARAALSLGRRFHGQNQVHCLDGLGMAAFVGVADERTKIDLASHLLSPLDHEPELIETLHAFFAENCSPCPAAERLSIHRNTLSYRLDKIASLTGLDPRRFDDAVQIRLALLLRDLQPAAA